MEEERPVQTQTLTVYDNMKGGRGFRFPLPWVPDFLRWLAGSEKVTAYKQECIFCGDIDMGFVKAGEPIPICPYSIMVCPCGCGKSFKYDKKEQEKLREKNHIGVSTF